jgi:hypothetical protein
LCIGCGTNGQRTRTRTCGNGGTCGNCIGPSSESETCTVGVFTSVTRLWLICQGIPRYWSAWTDASECAGCGTAGTKYVFMNLLLGSFSGNKCEAVLVRVAIVMAWQLPLCSVTSVWLSCDDSFTDCLGNTPRVWSAWSEVSICSNQCGSGTTSRQRSCNGDCGECFGASIESMACLAGGLLVDTACAYARNSAILVSVDTRKLQCHMWRWVVNKSSYMCKRRLR